MSGRSFLDTNVLVYAFDNAEPAKRERALALLHVSDSYSRFWRSSPSCSANLRRYLRSSRSFGLPAASFMRIK